MLRSLEHCALHAKAVGARVSGPACAAEANSRFLAETASAGEGPQREERREGRNVRARHAGRSTRPALRSGFRSWRAQRAATGPQRTQSRSGRRSVTARNRTGWAT